MKMRVRRKKMQRRLNPRLIVLLELRQTVRELHFCMRAIKWYMAKLCSLSTVDEKKYNILRQSIADVASKQGAVYVHFNRLTAEGHQMSYPRDGMGEFHRRAAMASSPLLRPLTATEDIAEVDRWPFVAKEE